MAQGKSEEALNRLNQASSFPTEKNWIISCIYPSFADYYIQQADYDRARNYLQDLMAVMNASEVKSKIGSTYYYEGDDREAEKYLTDLAGYMEKPSGRDYNNIAQSLIFLGRIAEHDGQREKVQSYYNSALKVLFYFVPSSYGVKRSHRAEQADVFNEMGKYYWREKKLIEADKSFREAIRLREETATQTHPNYADALRGLANVAALRGEITSATFLAENSLKILDTALVPTHPRISPTLIALASLYSLTEKKDQIEQINTRLDTILQKPLGPWKEEFLETADFYSGMLKKAGKNDAAARLEQLRIRQKDKR